MKYTYIFPLLAILLSVTEVPTHAFTWPDTGQQKCYNNYVAISCPEPGQSFHGQDGQIAGHQPSYTKLDTLGNPLPHDAVPWSMVRDNVTGLIWEAKTASGDQAYDQLYSWCDSTLEYPGICNSNNTESYIAKLNRKKFGGYSDWKLPTIQELATLIKSNAIDPAINFQFFPRTIMKVGTSYSVGYWSSTIVAGNSSRVWVLDFEGGGSVKREYRDDYDKPQLIRAVRGSSNGNKQQLQKNNNGTISDLFTGFMWKEEGQYVDSWKEALSYIEDLNQEYHGGYSDWRLPNRNELQSLVDYSRRYPAINTYFFPNAPDSYYISSTTEYGANENYWEVNFSDGRSSTSNKIYHGYVHPVRGGNRVQYALSVGLPGFGKGTVQSDPPGIACGSDCFERFEPGTTVTLTATPDKNSIFTGWSGECSGTQPCTITIDFHKSVQATFIKPIVAPIYLLLQKKDQE